MMSRFFSPIWVIVVPLAILCLFFLVNAHSVDAQQRAEPDSCARAAVGAVALTAGARLSRAESTQVVAWCREARATDERLDRSSTVVAAPTGPRSVPVTDITAPPSAIWCNKQICVCWKGKKHDGCVHVDKLCATGLDCGPGGKLCGCAAKS